MQNGLLPDDVLVVDSCSTDQTAELARKAGFDVQVIFQKNFSHGGTRAMMVERLDADIVVFLTQDAVLANENAVRELVLAFQGRKVGLRMADNCLRKTLQYLELLPVVIIMAPAVS